MNEKERGCCPNMPLTAIITCARCRGVRFSVSYFRAGEAPAEGHKGFHSLAAMQKHTSVFHSGCVWFRAYMSV